MIEAQTEQWGTHDIDHATPKGGAEITKNLYSCMFCGAGSQTFETLFGVGNCRHCGGPASEYGVTKFRELYPDIARLVVIVHAPDLREKACELRDELKANGISAISIEEVFQFGATLADRAETLAVASNVITGCKKVLVVPSEKLNLDENSGGEAYFANLSQAYQVGRGEYKTIPVILIPGSQELLPSRLQMYSGIDLTKRRETRLQTLVGSLS